MPRDSSHLMAESLSWIAFLMVSRDGIQAIEVDRVVHAEFFVEGSHITCNSEC